MKAKTNIIITQGFVTEKVKSGQELPVIPEALAQELIKSGLVAVEADGKDKSNE